MRAFPPSLRLIPTSLPFKETILSLAVSHDFWKVNDGFFAAQGGALTETCHLRASTNT
jgi:hypothetical protein